MPVTLFKKRLWHRCFPVNVVKFLGTPFLRNTSGRLLLCSSIYIFLMPCKITSFRIQLTFFHVISYTNYLTFSPIQLHSALSLKQKLNKKLVRYTNSSIHNILVRYTASSIHNKLVR